jgi:hypothetical protein
MEIQHLIFGEVDLTIIENGSILKGYIVYSIWKEWGIVMYGA